MSKSLKNFITIKEVGYIHPCLFTRFVPLEVSKHCLVHLMQLLSAPFSALVWCLLGGRRPAHEFGRRFLLLRVHSNNVGNCGGWDASGFAGTAEVYLKATSYVICDSCLGPGT
jgi:hypothetical protein